MLKPVSSLGFPRLPEYFSASLLGDTKIAGVNRIVLPPFALLDMPELSLLEEMPFAGITYAETIFVHKTAASEATVFHELVHVLQWRALGVDDFILTYGMGLIQHGYAQNPFEAVAFDLQSQFDRGEPIADIVGTVTTHSKRTREWAAEEFRRHGVAMGA